MTNLNTTINNNASFRMTFNAILNNAPRSKTGRTNAVIPVEMLDVDPLYQRIEGRNEKKLKRLKNEWDYNLMDALLVVPHPETNNFYVVDGLGRLTVARELGILELDCVIIEGPADPEERRKFEATYFVRQAVCTNPLRPVDMHNARLLNGDEHAVAIENLCNEYEVTIIHGKSHRAERQLGSYDRTYSIARRFGVFVLQWVFDVIEVAGYNLEPDGYSSRIIGVLGRFKDGYKDISAETIGKYLRQMPPKHFQAKACAAYPERGGESQMLLFLQDYVMSEFGKEKVFDDKGKKIA
jgi:hypothetical protein